MLLPSALAKNISYVAPSCPANASRVPSGLQLGVVFLGPALIDSSAPVATSRTMMTSFVPTPLQNAIWVPSGDQLGLKHSPEANKVDVPAVPAAALTGIM